MNLLEIKMRKEIEQTQNWVSSVLSGSGDLEVENT